MSNGRKPSAQAQDYRTGYLKSPTWFGRRDQWINTELGRVGQLTCACCQGSVDRKKVELHHLSYEGVERTADGWTAGRSTRTSWASTPAATSGFTVFSTGTPLFGG